MAASEIGVSSTRAAPNSSYNPLVTPKGLPRMPTSQPRMMTVGSRSISSRRVSLMAFLTVSRRLAVSPSATGVCGVLTARSPAGA